MDAVTTVGQVELGADGLPQIGSTLGPYLLLRRLGSGTTGTVFEVEHQRIARRAAMKVLSPMVPVPNVMDRFVVEAQAVNAIKDPHVVEITDILESADGRPLALVMELLEGESLGDLISRQPLLPLDRVLRILAHVCDGLAAVHAAGFVHRDLKPENIHLVRRDGEADFAKLLDFGLVKPCGEGGARSGCGTIEGTFLGSPAYASPEQAAGKNVDLRTDIYSIGVMAYELITGELPFVADGFREVLMKHMTAPPPHLPDYIRSTELGQTLDGILQACLSKDPEQRVYSAKQLAETFHALAGEEGSGEFVLRRRPGRWLTPRWRRGALAAPIALGALGLFLFLRHHAVQPAQAPQAVAPAAAVSAAPPVAQAMEASPARADESPADVGHDQPKRSGRRHASRAARPLDEATTLDPFQ